MSGFSIRFIFNHDNQLDSLDLEKGEKKMYEDKMQKLINRYTEIAEELSPLRVKADFISCRECGSKLNKRVVAEKTSKDIIKIHCPVCNSLTGLYSKTANERIEAAYRKIQEEKKKIKRDKSQKEKKGSVSKSSKIKEISEYDRAKKEVEERLEIIYDIYTGPDFTEYKGEIGGDVLCYRVLSDGFIYEK